MVSFPASSTELELTAGEQLILLKATAWISTVRMEEICLATYLEESPAPEIKDLDVWTDWVSSPATVALSIG